MKGRWLHPATDALAAMAAGANMVIASSENEHDHVLYFGADVDKSVAFWGLGVLPLIVFGAGAVYGVIQCSRCDTLLGEHNLDSDGKRVESAEEPVATVEQREERWSNPGDKTPAQPAEPAVLPDWSAFRREPLEPLEGEPKQEAPGKPPASEQP